MTAPRRGSSNRTTGIVVLIAVGLVALGMRNGSINLDRDDLIFFAILIPSVILHEVSHGWAALAFGDETAKRAGRLTLNPIAHVDIFGTIILPAILLLSAGFAFGYAKPVPVSPSRMRSPRNHSLLTSLAGPAVNIVLAAMAVIVLRLVLREHYLVIGGRWGHDSSLAVSVIWALGVSNLFLAVFNLIPLPPLDGSAVIERVLPERAWPTYLKLRQYSMLLLFVLVFWSGGVLERIFDPFFDFWLRLLA